MKVIGNDFILKLLLYRMFYWCHRFYLYFFVWDYTFFFSYPLSCWHIHKCIISYLLLCHGTKMLCQLLYFLPHWYKNPVFFFLFVFFCFSTPFTTYYDITDSYRLMENSLIFLLKWLATFVIKFFFFFFFFFVKNWTLKFLYYQFTV